MWRYGWGSSIRVTEMWSYHEVSLMKTQFLGRWAAWYFLTWWSGWVSSQLHWLHHSSAWGDTTRNSMDETLGKSLPKPMSNANAGFQKWFQWGYPQLSSILDRDFPWKHPASLGVPPWLWKPQNLWPPWSTEPGTWIQRMKVLGPSSTIPQSYWRENVGNDCHNTY